MSQLACASFNHVKKTCCTALCLIKKNICSYHPRTHPDVLAFYFDICTDFL